MAASNSSPARCNQRSSASLQSFGSAVHLLPRPRTSLRAHIPSFLTPNSSPEEDRVVPLPALRSPSSCYQSTTIAEDVFLDAPPYTSDAKDDALSFVTARISGTSVGDCSVVSDAGGRSPASSGDEFADDECSSCWSSSCGGADSGGWASKPHQGNDARWDAIRAVRTRDGHLGLSQFRLLDRVGSGEIGCVYLAELGGTGCLFAVKAVNKAALVGRKRLSRAHAEREILQCFDHPFLPTLYAHFEADGFSCLVMEFCPGGDLRSLQQRQPEKRFTEKAARFYAAEVLLALEYLHMLGIIYRDLKPENILIREDGHIMLSDFDLSLRCAVFPTLVRSTNSMRSSGNCAEPSCVEPYCMKNSCLQPTCFSPSFRARRPRAKKASASEAGDCSAALPELVAEPSSARSRSFVGTHEYLAPEVIKGEGHGSAVDWWSFGVLLYELLLGKTPFEGSGKRATLFNVVGEPLKFPELPMVSFAARDLIRGLLVKEPQQRLAYGRGATEIKQHSFFESVNWALIRCTSPPEVPRTTTKDQQGQALNGIKMEGSLKPSGSGQYLDMDFF